jgi:hypothetical protein
MQQDDGPLGVVAMSECLHFGKILFVMCVFAAICGTANAQPISPEMRTADPRLEKTVSISEKEIYLGELLDRVAKQSGISVRLDQDDAGANAKILISVSQMRLANLMNDLWSLSSFQKAEWKWLRSGQPGSYSYILMRPGPARDLPEKLKSKIQIDFEQHVARLERASRMTDAEKKRIPGNEADDLEINSARTMLAMAIFSEQLSADDQRSVLSAVERRQVSTAGLSDSEKQFVTRWANGVLPPYIVFKAQRSNDDLAPSLFLMTPNANGTESGYGNAGGVPLGLAESSLLEASWLLPGDSSASDLDKRTISFKERPGEFTFNHVDSESMRALQALPMDKRRELIRRAHLALETELTDLSNGAAIPVIAILPTSQSSGQLANGDTVSVYLKKVNPAYKRQLMVKWRNDALLLCSPSWFYHALERMAWSTVTELRRIADEGVPLERLLRAVERITRMQIDAVSDEFPFLKPLVPAQNLFGLYYKYPQILAAEGLKVSADNVEAIRMAVSTTANTPLSVSGVDWRRPITLYFTQKETSDGAVVTKNIMFDLEYDDGTTAWYKPVRIRYNNAKPSLVTGSH